MLRRIINRLMGRDVSHQLDLEQHGLMLARWLGIGQRCRPMSRDEIWNEYLAMCHHRGEITPLGHQYCDALIVATQVARHGGVRILGTGPVDGPAATINETITLAAKRLPAQPPRRGRRGGRQPRDQSVIAWIEAYAKREDRAPTWRQVASAHGLPRTTARRYLTYALDQGPPARTVAAIEASRSMVA